MPKICGATYNLSPHPNYPNDSYTSLTHTCGLEPGHEDLRHLCRKADCEFSWMDYHEGDVANEETTEH